MAKNQKPQRVPDSVGPSTAPVDEAMRQELMRFAEEVAKGNRTTDLAEEGTAESVAPMTVPVGDVTRQKLIRMGEDEKKIV